jgi:Domain of unknown function (DUF4124)
MFSRQVFPFLILLCMAITANARVFKWTDGNGETHYSEKAPEGQQVLEMHESSQPVDADSTGANQPDAMMQQLESVEAAHKAREEEQKKNTAEQNTAIKDHQCAQAKHDLHVLQQQVPVYSLNDKGERVYVDDDERAKEIKGLSDAIATNCE